MLSFGISVALFIPFVFCLLVINGLRLLETLFHIRLLPNMQILKLATYQRKDPFHTILSQTHFAIRKNSLLLAHFSLSINNLIWKGFGIFHCSALFCMALLHVRLTRRRAVVLTNRNCLSFTLLNLTKSNGK